MIEKYLEFRFKKSTPTKYHKYFKEWLSGVTEEQIIYFEREMFNLMKSGTYDPGR